MSRIGKNPIIIPEGVKVDLNNDVINVSGQKGTQSWRVHQNIKAVIKDNNILFERIDNSAFNRSVHGTTRQIVNNMVIGVSNGFKQEFRMLLKKYSPSLTEIIDVMNNTERG